MSQITTYFQPTGPGSGTVTSVTGGVGINITGNPTVNPTVNLTIPVTVNHGGTGAVTFTPYAVITAGTTATGPFQNVVGVGTLGQYLTSQGAGTLPVWTTDPGGAGASIFHTDSGTANASANAITIHGTHGINTSGAAATVTVAINNAITLGDLASIIGSPALTLTTGDVTLAAGNINLPVTSADGLEGIITWDGIPYISEFGDRNIFVGRGSGNTSNTGSNSSGFGEGALSSLTTGTSNTALGALSLLSVMDGGSNTAAGAGALGLLTSGSNNVAVGESSQTNNVGSGDNTSIGTASLLSLIGGSGANTALGAAALENLTSGTGNIAIGESAGENYTSTESNNILLANTGIVGDNDVMRLGDGSIFSTFIFGIAGVTTSNSAMVTIDTVANQLGSAPLPTSLTWQVITAGQTMVSNNGYIDNDPGTSALLLPATSAVGDILRVTGINNPTGWEITQNAGQTIHFGTFNTTTGVGGSLASTQTRDSVELVCVIANTDWNVLSSIGNITVV